MHQAITEQAKLTTTDGAAGDFIGEAVSISGNRALVGGSQGTFFTGAAYIFVFDGVTWKQEARLVANDIGPASYFGNSVSLSGNRALVGAVIDGPNGARGAAYIFAFDGTTWRQQAKLRAADGEAGDHFGSSVSLSGNRALVGANQDGNGSGSGAELVGSAYVFVLRGGNWRQEAKLTASDAIEGDEVGSAVALLGNRALLGATHAFESPASPGVAYTFVLNGATWSQEAKLSASDGTVGNQFGGAVALSGSRALIGAYNSASTGSAYVFAFDGTFWSEEAKLTASDATSNSFFGASVSLSGQRALVGASGALIAGTKTGAAYFFSRTGTTWALEAELTPPPPDNVANEYFGSSVSLAGPRLLVGASGDVNRTGAAYVFVP